LNIAKIFEATIVFDESQLYASGGHNSSEYLSIMTDILGINISFTTNMLTRTQGLISHATRDISFTEVQTLKKDLLSGKSQLQCNTVLQSDIQSCNGRWCPTESTYPFVDSVKWELRNNHASEMCMNQKNGFTPSDTINVMWHIRNGDICLHCNEVNYIRKIYDRILQLFDFSDFDVGSRINFFFTASNDLPEYKQAFPNFHFSTEKTPLLQTLCDITSSDIFISSGSSIVVVGAFFPPGHPLIIEEERKNLHREIFKQRHIFTENQALLMFNGDFSLPFSEVKSLVRSTLDKKLSSVLKAISSSLNSINNTIQNVANVYATPNNPSSPISPSSNYFFKQADAECRLLKNFDNKEYYFVLYGFKLWIKDSLTLSMASFVEDDAIVTNTSFINSIPGHSIVYD